MDKLTHSAAEAVPQGRGLGGVSTQPRAGGGVEAGLLDDHPGSPAAPARSPARRGRGLALPLADALRILDGGRDAGRSWPRRLLDSHPAVDPRMEALLAQRRLRLVGARGAADGGDRALRRHRYFRPGRQVNPEGRHRRRARAR